MIRIPLSDSDRVEYLTRRKFPLYPHIEVPEFPAFASASTSNGMSRENKQKYIKDIESYKRELRAKSSEELRDFCQQEEEKERQELQAKRELDEQLRFFNLPNAKADFTHWSKAAHWTLDEAIALSFGKAPEVVKWELVKEYVHISPFAFKYARVRDLALRAKAWKQLYDPVLPGIFLAWARRMEVEVPPELVAQVEARGIVIADWKDMFDKLKTQFDEYTAAAQTRFTENKGTIAELTQERDALKQQLEASDAPLHGSERASLLRMVLGMAMSCYDYKPGAPRNPATGEKRGSIAADLDRVGLTVGVDTVRKLINEAETRFKDINSNPQKP